MLSTATCFSHTRLAPFPYRAKRVPFKADVAAASGKGFGNAGNKPTTSKTKQRTGQESSSAEKASVGDGMWSARGAANSQAKAGIQQEKRDKLQNADKQTDRQTLNNTAEESVSKAVKKQDDSNAAARVDKDVSSKPNSTAQVVYDEQGNPEAGLGKELSSIPTQQEPPKDGAEVNALPPKAVTNAAADDNFPEPPSATTASSTPAEEATIKQNDETTKSKALDNSGTEPDRAGDTAATPVGRVDAAKPLQSNAAVTDGSVSGQPAAQKAQSSMPPAAAAMEASGSRLSAQQGGTAEGWTVLADGDNVSRLWNELSDTSKLGQRGELLFAGQLALLGLVVVAPSPLETVLTVTGAGMLAAGAYLVYDAQRQLGRNLTPIAEPRPEHNLVTSGVYGMVRHPMYGALSLLSLGLAAVTDDGLRFALALALILLLDRKADMEERFLEERYGEDYCKYKKQTKKMFPYLY